jgi:hypothetical protein
MVIGACVQQLSAHCDAKLFVLDFLASHFSKITVVKCRVACNHHSTYVKQCMPYGLQTRGFHCNSFSECTDTQRRCSHLSFQNMNKWHTKPHSVDSKRKLMWPSNYYPKVLLKSKSIYDYIEISFEMMISLVHFNFNFNRCLLPSQKEEINLSTTTL